MQSRRSFIVRTTILSASVALPTLAAGAISAGKTLTPEMFGAKGDGKTDDSAAFALLSDAVNANGGGTVALRRTTYLVGTVGPKLEPVRLMAFHGCTRALVIRGNGATLRCADGQRYGIFAPDGSPADRSTQKSRSMGVRQPYRAMISAMQCSGPVEISDLELDGNLEAHVVGGKSARSGRQIQCNGLILKDNLGPETVTNIHAHHHALDGIFVDGTDAPTPGVRRRLTKLRSDANGRQGMSVTGGHDYEFIGCSFTRTARGKIVTSPSAGVDIETDKHKWIRNLSFVDCTFADNRGCGLVADSGDSADVNFTGCTFIGTTIWSVWPKKPGFVFTKCLFLGTVVQPFTDPDPARATKFIECTFSDDPGQSPTGKLQLHNDLCADIPSAQNVLFDRCEFIMKHEGILPWSKGAIWSDCVMSQSSSQTAHTRGIFRGTNRITGPVDVSGSTIEGLLVINGKTIPRNIAG